MHYTVMRLILAHLKLLLCLWLQLHQQLRYSQADLQTYRTVLYQLAYSCELALSSTAGWLANFGRLLLNPSDNILNLACSHSCYVSMHGLI